MDFVCNMAENICSLKIFIHAHNIDPRSLPVLGDKIYHFFQVLIIRDHNDICCAERQVATPKPRVSDLEIRISQAISAGNTTVGSSPREALPFRRPPIQDGSQKSNSIPF